MDYKASLPSPMMSKLAGQQVGPFQLIRVLGSGGTGVVYLAGDTILHRNVALKLIAKQHDARDSFLHEVFMREARAAARLIHPNVVQIYQIGETSKLWYIAMEYVPGMTALKMAKRNGQRLSEDLCLKMMRDAADALALAGSMGICHRDIKPSNMLVTRAVQLKIADFGLAAHAYGDESIGTASPNQIQGTPYYMSPEQWQGATITSATDVYSLGCSFYRLLCGTPPYGEGDFFASRRGHCELPVPDPRQVLPGTDPALAGLLWHCMAKQPEDRPTAADIVAAIDELLFKRSLDDKLPGQLAEGSVNDGDISQGRHTTIRDARPGFDEVSEVSTPRTDIGRRVRASSPSQVTGSFTYSTFFNLDGYPFSDIRVPNMFWTGGPFGSALHTLAAQLVGGSRVTMLVGAAGSGRTFLGDMLHASYPDIVTFRIESQLLFGEQILLALCRQNTVQPNPGSSLRFLAHVLLSRTLPVDRKGAMGIVVIDTVDLDDSEILADIHQTVLAAAGSPLAVLLVGDVDLREQLIARGAAEELYTGAPPVLLRPMTQDEMVEFIQFRIRQSGGTEHTLPLDASTRQLLHMRSGGSPKLVNVYCHNAMTLAALRGEPKASFESFRLAMKKKTYLSLDAGRELLREG